MEVSAIQAVRVKFERLIDALCKALYEREEATKLALLSSIAGESIFFLGPPGVGKSLIARRLKYAFSDGTSFEYLMSKFSTPDEIFGPISIKKLKEEDKYERQTENYLPSANIVFLDEIWKAGPAIQNALLTILNEKIYRNGNVDMKVNIRGIITASNELPPANKNLAPIWDRFLIRLEIGNIRKFKNFLDMIVDTQDVYEDNLTNEQKLSEQELSHWSEAIDEIEVPPEVINTIQVVKIKLDQYNANPNHSGREIQVFDRRWKKIIRLLRTSAFLNGRQKADLMDCFLMIHCLWSKPDQLDTIKEMVSEAIRKHGYSMAVNLNMLKREVTEFEEEVEKETKITYTQTENHPVVLFDEYYALQKTDNKFEGALIATKQFRQLSLDEPEVINFYDDEKVLRNRLKAQKSPVEHSIEVFHNSIKYSIPLQTKKIETSEIVYKKPHPLVEQHWEDRFKRVQHFIEKQLDHIQDNPPPEIKNLEQNLFVDPELSTIVKANLKEVTSALEQLNLRLEKIRYAYQNIE